MHKPKYQLPSSATKHTDTAFYVLCSKVLNLQRFTSKIDWKYHYVQSPAIVQDNMLSVVKDSHSLQHLILGLCTK